MRRNPATLGSRLSGKVDVVPPLWPVRQVRGDRACNPGPEEVPHDPGPERERGAMTDWKALAEKYEAALRAIVTEDQVDHGDQYEPDYYAGVGFCARIAREALDELDGEDQ